MGINDFGGANDPLANPPLGGPNGWAASVADAITVLQGKHEVRSTRPNGTDRLVEVFDGTAWVRVHYDSGWRDVSGSLEAPWTGTWRVRRENNNLYHSFYDVKGGTGPAWIAPSGFRGGQAVGNGCLFPVAVANMQGAALFANNGHAGTWEPFGAAIGEAGMETFAITYTPDPVPSSLPGTTGSTAP